MQTRSVSLFSAALILTLAVLACSKFSAPTQTPAPPPVTDTPLPSPTQTARPTFTPLPSATPQPTPAPLGSPVKYNSLEITVIDVVNRESVHFGDVSNGWETFYKPSTGHFLIDMGVVVHNLNSGNVTKVAWSNIYIVEANNDAWYPLWGKARMVRGQTKLDPFSIGLSSTRLNGDDLVDFQDNTYLRLIFSVVDDPQQTILFGIGDSPMISFQVGK